MREIKFRGKSVENDTWVYGSLVIHPEDNTHWVYTHVKENEWIITRVNCETIGMKLENYLGSSFGEFRAQEIYVGDIIEDFINKKRYLVCWDNGFWFRDLTNDNRDWLIHDELDEQLSDSCSYVVGNEFDDKQLLEGESIENQ